MTVHLLPEKRAISAISTSEFEARVGALIQTMRDDGTDLFLVYGDEYRREHLRYVSNFWPIFERGMLVVTQAERPVLVVGPEGLQAAREMSIWSDIRVVSEMEMAYVPEQIHYAGETNAAAVTLGDVIGALFDGKPPKRVKVCGIDAMSVLTFEAIKASVGGASVESGDKIIYGMRSVKSPAEASALTKAWEICDAGYGAFLDSEIIGLTETQAVAIAEKAARDAGAESIVFSLMGSGERTNTVVGRATEKVIVRGEMVMFAFAVQYDGYIATNEWPFVAGGEATPEQFALIKHLIMAEHLGVSSVKSGVVSGHVVRTIQEYFKEQNLANYDLYPPIHGNGLAEAESPYPDSSSTYVFERGMGINFDVSLFNIPGVGSNRIEEGFVVLDDGLQPLSQLISGLRGDFVARHG